MKWDRLFERVNTCENFQVNPYICAVDSTTNRRQYSLISTQYTCFVIPVNYKLVCRFPFNTSIIGWQHSLKRSCQNITSVTGCKWSQNASFQTGKTAPNTYSSHFLKPYSVVLPLLYRTGMWSVANRDLDLIPTNSGLPRRVATHSPGKWTLLKHREKAPSCWETEKCNQGVTGEDGCSISSNNGYLTSCWMTCSTNSRNE